MLPEPPDWNTIPVDDPPSLQGIHHGQNSIALLILADPDDSDVVSHKFTHQGVDLFKRKLAHQTWNGHMTNIFNHIFCESKVGIGSTNVKKTISTCKNKVAQDYVAPGFLRYCIIKNIKTD
jgi:hypothetical protein